MIWQANLMFGSASFCPCFHVICSHDFSHTLIPDMQNFVPRIPPADPVWSFNHASDHTSKVDIKFGHICIVDALGPSSKTSDWCHDGIEEFQFVSHGYISVQKKSICWQKNA